MMELIFALLIIILSSIVIMFACDSFEGASNYLGRNMAPGVKGATINAIGSSLPELMTALFLLFLYHDQDGFSAGIATTAGSAVFNAVVIPMVCILVIRFRGVKHDQYGRKKVHVFKISKSPVVRDGIFLLIAEAVLIWFLSGTVMFWWMGAGLILIYGCYFWFLRLGFGSSEDEEEVDEEEELETTNLFYALMTFDFNRLLFGGRNLTNSSAWIVLSMATTVIGLACWALAYAVVLSANLLEVPTYFTALIFAAAATSVPDTILSMKDALNGNYDDAISNALGSNTFDITVAIGLPLLLYGLIFGDVNMSASNDLVSSGIQQLRIVLLFVTIIVLASFILPKKITVHTAWGLLILYLVWNGFVLFGSGLF